MKTLELVLAIRTYCRHSSLNQVQYYDDDSDDRKGQVHNKMEMQMTKVYVGNLLITVEKVCNSNIK